MNRRSAFHKRLKKLREIQRPQNQEPPPRQSPVELLGHFAQIALAVVAIFGYFYTVRPIYQKDRLEEQVAEYQGIINEQKPKVASLELQLNRLSREREKLNKDLANLNNQLELARAEKEKIEEQTQFMTFRYRLPNGKPATTHAEVSKAQDHQLSQSLLGNLYLQCGIFRRNDAFSDTTYTQHENAIKNKLFPFSQKELNAWRADGGRLPILHARNCARSYIEEFSNKYANHPRDAKLAASLGKDILQSIDDAGRKPWTPPFEPQAIIKELAQKRTEIAVELENDYKKAEDDYGDWESVWGEARRSIVKYNYEVSRANAKNKAYSANVSLTWAYQEKANAFRKQLSDEANRIIETASKVKNKEVSP